MQKKSSVEKRMSSLPLAFDVLTQQGLRSGSQITSVDVWAKKKPLNKIYLAENWGKYFPWSSHDKDWALSEKKTHFSGETPIVQKDESTQKHFPANFGGKHGQSFWANMWAFRWISCALSVIYKPTRHPPPLGRCAGFIFVGAFIFVRAKNTRTHNLWHWHLALHILYG